MRRERRLSAKTPTPKLKRLYLFECLWNYGQGTQFIKGGFFTLLG